MKILLLTTHLNTGGIGVYTVGLARYLKKEGIDVTVSSSGGDLEGILAEEGVPFVRTDIKTKSEFGPKVWKALPRLNKLITEGSFDLVHAQTRVAQVLSDFSCRTTGVPFVSTCHGFFKHKRLSRKVFPCWGEKVIAISESVSRHLTEDFGVPFEKIAMIHNGIELDKYVELSQEKDPLLMQEISLPEGVTVIGSIGRLSSVKGFEYLVAAFERVLHENTNVALLIIGEGPEKDALERQIKKSGIEGKTFLIPESTQLKKHLSLFDIFCLPSVNEGLGLSIMEAMAAGRACIASEVGGLPELITDNVTGVLVPPGKPYALSRAILNLAGDPDLRQRLGAAAREKALKSFSIKNSVRATVEVYKEVIARSS
ncbi:MAG: glycosyltransferase family 4 protein [Candidatus Omnitrophica bacterium]|nr:glycosyltransferase family 4 protein [Candidatus Omnitrophota bacterium]